MTRTKEFVEATRINQIIAPWLPVNPERMIWTVTLAGGTEITICCPLGAAVEIEEAGHLIRAQG
jgi:hypothetical protein